jgi:hypothetical protein
MLILYQTDSNRKYQIDAKFFIKLSPHGKRARGTCRPRNSWRRSTLDEMEKAGYN